MASQAKLLSHCFSKSYSMANETFQSVAPILHSVICSEMNTASLTSKRLLQKERGSYKFMFSSVHFYLLLENDFTTYYIILYVVFYVFLVIGKCK